MRKIVLLAFFLSLILCGAALATPWTDTTIHWNSWTDGRASIDNTDAYGTPLFSGGTYIAGNGSLKQLTFDYYVHSWGSVLSAANLFIDMDANGNWDYVVPISSNNSATYNVYDIDVAETDHTGVYILSGAPSGYDWRHNHPVALRDHGSSIAGSVNFSGFDKSIGNHTTTFDFGSGLALTGNEFIFAWTVNCANDVVKETGQVPEPGILMLLGIGLSSLGLLARRKKETV